MIGKNVTLSNDKFTFGNSANFKDYTFHSSDYEYNMLMDVKFGDSSVVNEVQFKDLISPASFYPKLKIAFNNFLNSPHRLEFATGTIVDRTDDPFRGCLNKAATYLTDMTSVVQNDTDLEKMLCSRTNNGI